MNTPTLRSAVEQQRWDVVAHMLVYGLIKAQTNRNNGTVTNREELDCGKKKRTTRQSKRS